MARNAPDPSQRRTSSRVTKAPVQREAPKSWAQKQRDSRRMWVQVVAWLLVLAMMLPILIYFL